MRSGFLLLQFFGGDSCGRWVWCGLVSRGGSLRCGRDTDGDTGEIILARDSKWVFRPLRLWILLVCQDLLVGIHIVDRCRKSC